jgi:hypothetical protein
MRADNLARLVIETGRFHELMEHARGLDREHVIVICDLRDDGIGAAVAQVLNAKDFAKRGDADVWTFLYPMEAWQDFRERVVKTRDDFLVREGQAYAIVTGRTCRVGRLVKQTAPQTLDAKHWGTIRLK